MRKRVTTTIATTTALLAFVGLPSHASAAVPGDLCRVVSTGGTVFDTYPVPGSYILFPNQLVRIDGYGPIKNGKTTYYAHSSGNQTGWTYRSWIKQSTCY